MKCMKSAYTITVTLLILSIVMMSCGNGDTRPLVDPQNASSVNTMPAAPALGNDSIALMAPQSTAALNPKHGLPGHRCDIPVGAPLNSPPGNPAPAQAPAVVMPQQSGSVKLNPQHGQPGHRCDIAVGAPL
jgi:hypothetical protein